MYNAGVHLRLYRSNLFLDKKMIFGLIRIDSIVFNAVSARYMRNNNLFLDSMVKLFKLYNSKVVKCDN